jgi:putative intracellular protease/amidase
MKTVLMVLTGATIWTMKNGYPHPTGFWAEEFIAPYRAFAGAGLNVKVATPGGVRPTVDPLSLSIQYNNNDAKSVADQESYLNEIDAILASPLRLEELTADTFDVIFLVGGHGPMQDMAVHPTIGTLLADMLGDSNKIVAAVCHGPAGFLSAHKPDGSWLFKDRSLTGFSNEEETQATFSGNAPWLLEDRLRLAGARYVALPAWTPHVLVDGNLITGQQQVSAKVTAEAVLKQLGSAA